MKKIIIYVKKIIYTLITNPKKFYEIIRAKLHQFCRFIYLYPLYKKYGFDKWHLIPIVSKPYVKDIIKWLNKNSCEGDLIIECGCGLCDIISHNSLKRCKRLGIDLNENVCRASSILNKDICIKQGSFDIIKNKKIQALISVNFIHEISPKTLQDYYKKIIKNNIVNYFIIDSVTGKYKYTHNPVSLFENTNFSVVEKFGPYKSDGGERYIYILAKTI